MDNWSRLEVVHRDCGHPADPYLACAPGRGASADLSRVSGTPTFFINGRRHHGAYDIDHLSRAVRAAGARAKMAAS